MARGNYLILDSDLHMMEPVDLWERYLEGPARANPPKLLGRNKEAAAKATSEDKGNESVHSIEVQGLQIPPRNKWSAGATTAHKARTRQSRSGHPHFKVARAQGFDAPSTLTAMDIEGIDVAVMYGTRGRQILCHDDISPDYAAALARAYNNWAADYCKTDPQRLKFAAQVAMHDPKLAAQEARRAVKELGAVGVIGTATPVNGQHLHDPQCDVLWAEVAALNVPVGFHPTGNNSLRADIGQRYVGHANFFAIAHAIRNPVETMGALASMTTGGVLERHPALRVAFLECTAGWLHWWLWRLDDHWEKYAAGSDNQLSMLPSDYFKRQCYLALDVDEEPAVEVINKLGPDYFVVSSDYPHTDGAFPEAVQQFLSLPLNDEQRRKILWDNCARLYGIARPATPLAREVERSTAA